MNIIKKLRIKIRGQLLLYVLGSFLIIYCFTMGFLIYGNRVQHMSSAEYIAKTTSAQYANLVTEELNNVFQTTRTLAEMAKVSSK